MPDTREEAVRREFGKWAQEQIPKIADGGGNLPLAWLSWQASREVALREAAAAVASKAALWEKETKSYVGMLHETCGMRARCLRDAEKAILALIPVAEKEEKA